MIDDGYCRTMARYNAWQNRQLFEFIDPMTEAEISQDRGAFFGSILATLNHLAWGDHIWMSRLDGGPAPDVPGSESTSIHRDFSSWRSARISMDRRIVDWAGRLGKSDLAGELTWYSGVIGKEVNMPMAVCVVGMFNHQTHHRGQVHAMLTAAGSQAPVTDLFLMPEDM